MNFEDLVIKRLDELEKRLRTVETLVSKMTERIALIYVILGALTGGLLYSLGSKFIELAMAFFNGR